MPNSVHKTKNINYALLAGFFAPAIWGFISVPFRELSNYSVELNLFFRVLLTFLILIVFLSIFNRKNIVKDIILLRSLNLAARQKILLGVLAAGFAMSLNWFSYLYVLQNISLKSAALAYLIAPLFTAILAVIFYKDSLYKWQKVALALAVLAVSILSFSYFSEVLWSMLVAFFYAVYMIFQKWTSALNKLNVLFCHISIVLLSLFLLFDTSIMYIPQEISFWKNIASIVFIFTLLPLYLNLYANAYIPSSTLGILIYINPLVAFLLSIFYFDEEITFRQILVYFFIFFAVVLFNWKHIRFIFSFINYSNKKEP